MLFRSLRGRVELAIRENGGSEFWFLVNRTAGAVPLAGLDGQRLGDTAVSNDMNDGGTDDGGTRDGAIAPRGVAILHRERTPERTRAPHGTESTR